jgi:GntR family transcriptional repressor for pyruvate dehydrogenase complex
MPSHDAVLPTPAGRIVRAPKTAELIAADLRRRIVRGELSPGATLPPEIQLMGQSRPTLREAFRILETETLISVRRGSRGGAQVMPPDLSAAARSVGLLLQIQGTTVDDVIEARLVIEPHCARLLARRRTRRDLADLRATLEQVRAAAADPAERPVPLRRFHELVLARSGGKTLAVQGAVLIELLAVHQRLTGGAAAQSPARVERTLKACEKLVALVEARNLDGAEEHWRRHLDADAKPLGKGRPAIELFA